MGGNDGSDGLGHAPPRCGVQVGSGLIDFVGGTTIDRVLRTPEFLTF
jgi:hypothetical protein